MSTNSKKSKFSKAKWREEDGAAAVEYGLLVGLVATVLIVAATDLGHVITNQLEKTACTIAGKTWAPTNPKANADNATYSCF